MSNSQRRTARVLAIALGTALCGLVTTSAYASYVYSGYDTSNGTGSIGPSSGTNSQISRDLVIARAREWTTADAGQGVSYSEGDGWQDAATGGPYRADCSGFVSMAWGLSTSHTTYTLPNVAHELTSNGAADYSQLQPGDALLFVGDPAAGTGHVELFAGWADSGHTVAGLYEEAHSGTRASYNTTSISYFSANGFLPYRYNNIGGGAAAEEAFQANTGMLYTDSVGGPVNTQEGMMTGTSPSIARLANGSVVEAFQANSGFLYVETASGPVNTQEGMMAGTSPSIAALPGGGYVIAFQANNGYLYTRTDTGALVNTQEGMLSGTSPSIAASPTGGYQAAFQANTGDLFTRTDTGTLVDTQEGMMSGTSPSITALPGGGYVSAFQANNGFLYTRASSGALVNTQEGMLSGTSPSIAASPTGGYQVAFQANTGDLFTRTDTGALVDTQEGMMSGTSPAIAASSGGGYVSGFQANTGFLYTRTSSGAVANTQEGMMGGTSPAVVAN